VHSALVRLTLRLGLRPLLCVNSGSEFRLVADLRLCDNASMQKHSRTSLEIPRVRKLKAPATAAVEHPTTRVLLINELCGRLRISRATAYNLMNSGEIEYLRVGAHRRVTEAALEAFIASKTVNVA